MKAWILCMIAALGVYQAPDSLASVVIADDFDSYLEGTLPNNAHWPAPIPDHAELYWLTKATSTFAPSAPSVSVVSGALLGRSGNVISAVSTITSGKAGMSLELPAPIADEAGVVPWKITIDFYIKSAIDSIGTGTLSILSVYQDTVDNEGIVLGVDYVPGTSTIRIRNSTTYSNSKLYTMVAMGEWYTLTITGNSHERTASYLLAGGGMELAFVDDLPWISSLGIHDFFNQLVIGGGDNVDMTSTIYFDNFSFTAIPETSFAGCLLCGFLILWCRVPSSLSCRNLVSSRSRK